MSTRDEKCAINRDKNDKAQPPLAALIDGLAGLGGVHIRVRHELPPASMRLMETLGAVVEIDRDAPTCERVSGWAGERTRCRGCARVDRELQERRG